MAEEAPSREELRARLRSKTHAAAKKRRGGVAANEAGEASGAGSGAGAPDIVSTLMSMGLDDPALLKEITSKKTSDPKAIMSALTLPRLPDETEDAWLRRVEEDMGETARHTS